jgi:hypothetical protein
MTFTVVLRTNSTGAYRRLRRMLKTALRRDQLRAVDIREHAARNVSRCSTARAAGQTQGRRGDMTMDASKYAGAGFLGLDDVKDGLIKAEIAAVEEGGYKKLVLTFTNGLKFSLNATNTTEMIKAFGSETDDWRGERVELYAGEAAYQGKMVPSVRVTPLMRAAGDEKKPKPKPPEAPDDLADSIPF